MPTNSAIMLILESVMESRFIENGNRTIKDAHTGLVWQESYAYVETGNNISWYDAQDYIKKLNQEKLGGYEDWRLPDRLEIQSLYEIAKPFSPVGKHLFFILIRFLNSVMAVVFGQVRPGGLRRLVSSLTWEIFTGIPREAIKERFGRYVMTGNPD